MWRDGTPGFQKNERVEQCIADMCLQTRTLPLQFARKKCGLRECHSEGFHSFFDMFMFLVWFVLFLVSCNLEVLNCGGVAFDLRQSPKQSLMPV